MLQENTICVYSSIIYIYKGPVFRDNTVTTAIVLSEKITFTTNDFY